MRLLIYSTMILTFYDNFNDRNMKAGKSKKNPPIRYVAFEPITQKAVAATIGPKLRARAPRERKMPRTVPFWSLLPYFAVRVDNKDTTKAVAEDKIKFNSHKTCQLTVIFKENLHIAKRAMPI